MRRCRKVTGCYCPLATSAGSVGRQAEVATHRERAASNQGQRRLPLLDMSSVYLVCRELVFGNGYQLGLLRWLRRVAWRPGLRLRRGRVHGEIMMGARPQPQQL